MREVVLGLLEAAARLNDRRARGAPAIRAATGLSTEGVLLGFEHLERDVSDADFAALAAWARPQERVTVVLSATVFVAPLRAILLARLSSEEVVVRPSRRDPVFARALVACLADPRVRLDEELEPASVDRGVLHVYGSDETLAAIGARARVPLVGHGTGLGVAVVDGDLERAAAALALDVVAFDQRGCLSPRIAWVAGRDRAGPFAEALSRALAASPVPRGELSVEERAGATRYVEAMRCVGEVLAGEGHVVGCSRASAAVLPPPGRHVHVASFEDAAELARAIAPISRFVTTVGTDAAAWVGAFPPHARVAPLGRMQRPPLDGPVDRRKRTDA